MKAPRDPRSAPGRRGPDPATALPALLVAACLLGALSAAGQAPGGGNGSTVAGAERHGIFLDSLGVHLVNLEVVVTDRSGRPVTDLEREELELLVDGDPVEITHFFAVEDGERLLSPDELGEPGETVAAETTGEVEPVRVPPPDDQRLFLVVLVDQERLAAAARNRVLADLEARLDDLLGPADRVMVASQDRTVEVLTGFTDDRERLRRALGEVLHEAAGKTVASNEERSLLRELARAPYPNVNDPSATQGTFQRNPEIAAGSLLASIESYSAVRRQEIATGLGALGRFLDSLAGLPGRKALLYVSDGLPSNPAEPLIRAWSEKYGEHFGARFGLSSPETAIARYEVGNDLADLVALANADRVAFYSLSTHRGGGAGDPSLSLGEPAGSSSGLRNFRARSGLKVLTEATGGLAGGPGPGIAGLVARMRRDLSTYYSLGFPPPDTDAEADGERPGYHRVEVRVRRDGLVVRHPSGYVDKDAAARIGDRTLAALVLGETDNPLGVRLLLGEATPEGEADGEAAEAHEGKKGRKARRERRRTAARSERWELPITVEIPVANLVLIPRDGSHAARLTLWLGVADADGRTSPLSRVELPLDIPNARLLEALAENATFTARLKVRPGEQVFAVGVRDDIGAQVATVRAVREVGR